MRRNPTKNKKRQGKRTTKKANRTTEARKTEKKL